MAAPTQKVVKLDQRIVDAADQAKLSTNKFILDLLTKLDSEKLTLTVKRYKAEELIQLLESLNKIDVDDVLKQNFAQTQHIVHLEETVQKQTNVINQLTQNVQTLVAHSKYLQEQQVLLAQRVEQGMDRVATVLSGQNKGIEEILKVFIEELVVKT